MFVDSLYRLWSPTIYGPSTLGFCQRGYLWRLFATRSGSHERRSEKSCPTDQNPSLCQKPLWQNGGNLPGWAQQVACHLQRNNVASRCWKWRFCTTSSHRETAGIFRVEVTAVLYEPMSNHGGVVEHLPPSSCRKENMKVCPGPQWVKKFRLSLDIQSLESVCL